VSKPKSVKIKFVPSFKIRKKIGKNLKICKMRTLEAWTNQSIDRLICKALLKQSSEKRLLRVNTAKEKPHREA